MINALLIDWLNDGALPIYEVPAETEAWHVADTLMWDNLNFRLRPHRILVALSFDTTLAELEADLLSSLIQGVTNLARPTTEGTLIFSIRTCAMLEGVSFVVGGMAFVGGTVAEASPLGEADPAVLILDYLRGRTGQDTAAIHPAVQTSLQRRLLVREEAETRRRLDTKAAERSRVLLESFLNPAQLAEFREDQTFHMTIQDGRRFKITSRMGYNVYLLDDQGVKQASYCVISREAVPLFDQMLAQKVMLEAVPDEFFRIANREVRHDPNNNPFIDP